MRAWLYLLVVVASLAFGVGIVQLRAAEMISNFVCAVLLFFVGALFFAGTLLIDLKK